MELKFRVKDFSSIRREIKKLRAKLIDKRTENYIYLKSGNKLQRTKRKFYFVIIKKRRNFFELKYKQITKNEYNKILKKEKIKKILSNKRQIYKLNSTQLSFNWMKIGNYVILDGKKKGVLNLSKNLRLKNPVTKLFSDL